MSVLSRCRTPSVCSAAFLLLIGLLPGRRALAQQADEALVGELARLLAVADARRFDGPLLGDALRHSDPAVRRQAALAAGRIGDPAAVDLLVQALADSTPAVRAAAAFGLGLLHQARSTGPLLITPPEKAEMLPTSMPTPAPLIAPLLITPPEKDEMKEALMPPPEPPLGR